MESTRQVSRTGTFSLISFGLTVATTIGAIGAALGARFGLWDITTGLLYHRYTLYGSAGALLLTLVALIACRPGGGRRGFPLAGISLLVIAGTLYGPVNLIVRALASAPIIDVTTNLEDPPGFEAALAFLPPQAGAPAVSAGPAGSAPPLSLDYGGPRVAAIQREAYPDIRPHSYAQPVEQVFRAALDAVDALGLELLAQDTGRGRIEARYVSFWFGFNSFLVIEMKADRGGATVVDVRSRTRSGETDLGGNAARIRQLFERIDQTLLR